MPNACFNQVAETAIHSVSKDDFIVLIGGTNDTLRKTLTPIYSYSSLESKFIHLSKTLRVFVTTVPQRFDLKGRHVVHNDNCLVNSYIRELVPRLKSVYLLDLDVLEGYHFTTQGLHVNN